MSDFDMDIEENVIVENVADPNADDSTPSQQRVKVRRRLEDYLHLRKLRDEVDYMMSQASAYNDDQLDAYGLGEGAEA